MAHDADYFRRRAAEARAAACDRDSTETVEAAGQLALAYSALARRRAVAADVPGPLDSVGATMADAIPLMLRD